MSNQTNNQMIEKYYITIEVITGLHIGSGDEDIKIGMVNTIVKDLLTEQPYIPASSFKGKIRKLLEQKYKNNEKENEIKWLFGKPASKKTKDNNNQEKQIPTILIIRDGFLENADEYKVRKEVGINTLEEKTEISITEARAVPRTMERIPRGYKFKIEIIFREYLLSNSESEEKKPELKDLINLFNEGVELLNDDYLGGNGSRGYGQVKVSELQPEKQKTNK
jgi:CRISPR-associated protein Csm3